MSDRTSPAPDPDPSRPGSPGNARRAAGALTLLEALVVVGFSVFYAYEIITGATSTVTTAVTSGLLILVFGVGLAALARGWLRGQDWPRTPTLFWNAILLPVAWSLHDGGRDVVALAVGAVAVASIAAALGTPMRRSVPGGDDEQDGFTRG